MGTNSADHGCDILFCGRLCVAVIRAETIVFQYLQGKISIGKYDILLDALIGDRQRAMDFCQKYPAFLHMNTSGSREKTFWDLYIFPVKIWEAGKRMVHTIHPQKL